MPDHSTRSDRNDRPTGASEQDCDLLALELIRLASADAWSRDRAARALLAKRPSGSALRRVQRWVAHARADSTNLVADRAAATLTATLALLNQDRSGGTRYRDVALATRATRRSDELAYSHP